MTLKRARIFILNWTLAVIATVSAFVVHLAGTSDPAASERAPAADLAAKTTPQFAAAVSALVLACQAFEALDDQPYQVDNTAPRGPGDLGA